MVQTGVSMAEPIQCNECGAVLLPEDLFCGECGAPYPASLPAADVAVTLPAVETPLAGASPAPALPVAVPSKSRWRIAVIVLLALGACLCLMGVSMFLLFGLTDSNVATPEENWLYATFLCLLPIAGMGAVLALTGVGIWFSRLRNR
jgi:hypothetical protein